MKFIIVTCFWLISLVGLVAGVVLIYNGLKQRRSGNRYSVAISESNIERQCDTGAQLIGKGALGIVCSIVIGVIILKWF